jgi:hypothetical protein
MSRLEFYARPLVAFDPSNKDHRRWYYEFLEYRGWGRCPVRFICTEDHGTDLTVMIRNALVEYYVNKEFKPKSESKLRTIVNKLVAQKTPKTVDKRTKR